ncbi:dienelactone hydrolase family protein [Halorussus salinisoli]|uniref:dienelactone hydrolase family protein n=1 Tax=Halorussus salinisoli TaxID=2558242 RepID=UPI002A910C62|nr:alpha/beta hydrolase [Halorussus salinisoli]
MLSSLEFSLMVTEEENIVHVPVDGVELEGDLRVPADASGLVVFAHGSGSSRHSPRNNYVAEVLRSRGLGTFLFDLLTEEEDRSRENRFDIPLLTDRLVAVTDWLEEHDATSDLAHGYFGSSTGAAAALRATARRGSDVEAVVSRGGRVDMASEHLGDVRAATLFVVGGEDTDVLELNRDAFGELDCEKELAVVEGAGHLFEGEGELEEVSELAADWFADHLA